MKVLVPILSRRESDSEFFEQLSSKAQRIVLLTVIDREEMAGQFGFAATEMMQASKMMEELENMFREKKISAESVTEWGNTAQKIASIALLRKCDKIVLQKQHHHRFQELVEEIRLAKDEKTGLEVI